MRAVLFGYGIVPDKLDHAIRRLRSLIHGYGLLHADKAFHWSNDPAQTITWMIEYWDAGLTALAGNVNYHMVKQKLIDEKYWLGMDTALGTPSE